jgi:hypothetical protein
MAAQGGQNVSDIIAITVTQQAAALLLAGFGVPMIAAYHTHYMDLLRFYSGNSAGLAQMVTDGFSTTEAAYLAASAICAQTPAPSTFAVGRTALPATQKFTFTPPGSASGAGVTYQFYVDGQLVQYTSVGTDSVTTIVTGLQTAFNALGSPPALTASIPGNANLTLVANTAGAFHNVQVVDANLNASSVGRGLLSCAQTHADPGIATDLAAINAFNSGWYGLINPWDSKLMAAAAAAWIQSNGKIYIVNSVDDAILTSSTTDIASAVKASAYTRVAVMYKSENVSFAQAAWMGCVLPLVAGSENWAYKQLAGVPVDTLSENEIINSVGQPAAGTRGKYANAYLQVFGENITEWGQVGSGSWLDVTRGIDALIQDMGSRIFLTESAPNKVPFTDPGIALIEQDIRASLRFFQAAPQNFLAQSPAPSVVVPTAASLSSADRQNRLLPGVTFQANLAGAINAVTVQGTVLF